MSKGALSGSRKPSPSGLGPSGFDPARLGYLDRLHPKPATPDWNDVEAVTQWIEGTRWRAFFAGARHDEISRVEAEALVAALARENDWGLLKAAFSAGRQSALAGDDALRAWNELERCIPAIAMEARRGTDPKGLDGEAATARPEGIAQTTPQDNEGE